MESVFEGIGIAALSILALIGLAVGWIAGVVTGRSPMLYALIGAVAAMAMPFLLAAFGLTVLATGGVIILLLVGAVGAAIVVGLVRVLSRQK